MSVLILDLKVYEAVYNKAWSYQFNNVCDINYCYTLKKYTENQLKEIIKNWLWLNEMSYNCRYEESNIIELPELLKFYLSGKEPINTYQMLKYLECIKYNIEISTIIINGIEIPEDKKDSYKILKDAVNEIKNVIISELPQYKKAKWSQI